jgi:hypothetical protein
MTDTTVEIDRSVKRSTLTLHVFGVLMKIVIPSLIYCIGLTRDHLLANTYQATTPTNLNTPLWLSCSVGHTEM